MSRQKTQHPKMPENCAAADARQWKRSKICRFDLPWKRSPGDRLSTASSSKKCERPGKESLIPKQTLTRWGFLIRLIITSKFGQIIQLWRSYFFNWVAKNHQLVQIFDHNWKTFRNLRKCVFEWFLPLFWTSMFYTNPCYWRIFQFLLRKVSFFGSRRYFSFPTCFFVLRNP